jgi:transglutaminase-like putative cysteine protease
MTELVRTVSCHIVMTVEEPASADLQVMLADPPDLVDEVLTITCDGQPIEQQEAAEPGTNRVQSCLLPAGQVEIDYSATVTGRSPGHLVTATDTIVYRRPSRYAESDRLTPIARAEFAGITEPSELLPAVSSWVGSRLIYVSGSSQPTDGAVDTLLNRRGVCRDYAHLVVALLRALDVPARVAAVYAPGLDPMDFHAVAEAAVDGAWQVVDATLLAPRSTLLRIATGRDAADTAFISTYGGATELVDLVVTATSDGDLPADDVTRLVQIT